MTSMEEGTRCGWTSSTVTGIGPIAGRRADGFFDAMISIGTDEALVDWGLDPERVAALKDSGAIR